LKDHYKILGVPPGANRNDIKKAYRALAMQFHPDKSPGNPFAETRFIEIQQAYSVLYDPTARKAYDDERWLNGMGARTDYSQTVTPEWLLDVSRKLNQSLASMDIHRISHGALQQYILLILADAHLGVLTSYNNKEANKKIVGELLKAAGNLELKYLGEITQRLEILADEDRQLHQAIKDTYSAREREELRVRLFPYIILLVTLVLCLFMYFYGNGK